MKKAYYDFVKIIYQKSYKYDKSLESFLCDVDSKIDSIIPLESNNTTHLRHCEHLQNVKQSTDIQGSVDCHEAKASRNDNLDCHESANADSRNDETDFHILHKGNSRNDKIESKLLIHKLDSTKNKKIIWGDCLDVLKQMKSESIGCMVTSPPYYNAREYAQYKNLNEYLAIMESILKECYRVLDNHRVFVFNVGDIFDNDNLKSTSTWGKRRLPLGAYFINLFEKVGFSFVDDIIWDKGEVQSQRQKNGGKDYPYYQYPMNCYEHILIFHKHRLDNTRYPCPVCGCLNVNGNAYSEINLKSWECKNKDCFERSAANRGKRFSAKTYFTQNDAFNVRSEIPREFITAWRRDIKKINPVIKINSKGQNILGHTAPFPLEIPEYAVRCFSYKGEMVLDPFSG